MMKTLRTKTYSALLTEGLFNENWHETKHIMSEYGFDSRVSDDGCKLIAETDCGSDLRDFVVATAKVLKDSVEYLWSIKCEDEYEVHV
jgi:hypothetical protein